MCAIARSSSVRTSMSSQGEPLSINAFNSIADSCRIGVIWLGVEVSVMARFWSSDDQSKRDDRIHVSDRDQLAAKSASTSGDWMPLP